MRKTLIYLLLAIAGNIPVFAQTVQIQIDPTSGRHLISPYIYGRNGSLSDDPSNPLSAATWQMYRDAGLNFTRENGGNDLTKYNWRLKLDSHPDWYNNVYASDWGFAAQSLHQNMPTAQGMWGFQLIGQAASNTNNNFDDWDFNGSQWWSGVSQNLAGGGVVNTAGGSQALVNGNPSLYLEPWSADSTTGVLTHWFGRGGLGLDSTKIRYWNMDNEVEIWSSTHDDIMPTQPSAEAFMQLYFAVAKAARALYPGIKLTGPVSPNEWQWYNWNNALVTGSDGKQYPWLEFFIKRISEEQQATGIRLLDVIDLHFYPGSSNVSDVVQYGRVFFDSTYAFPEANGVKVVGGGWDNSIQIEDVFGRAQNWLNQYLGSNNGVTFAVSEAGTQLQNNPSALAVWYASTMGEFEKHNVDYFSPWTWDFGMWEALHLYSRYNKKNSVSATSSDETDLSAYASATDANDSMTVVLVNRSTTQTETTTLNFSHFTLGSAPVPTLTLSNLPVGKETFVSHTNNALQASNITPNNNNTLTVTMAPMSITSLQITAGSGVLPIDLVTFTAEKSDIGTVRLDFTATEEAQLASIEIDRSPDGAAFTPIGSVPASAGSATAGGEGDYTYYDRQPLPSVNYYRLKLIDQHGGSTYSRIVAITFDGDLAFSIFPNPAKDLINIQWTMPAGAVPVRLIDASGRTIRSLEWSSDGNAMSASIDISGLSRGIYYIAIGGRQRSFVKE